MTVLALCVEKAPVCPELLQQHPHVAADIHTKRLFYDLMWERTWDGLGPNRGRFGDTERMLPVCMHSTEPSQR